MFFKIGVLKIVHKFHRKRSVLESFWQCFKNQTIFNVLFLRSFSLAPEKLKSFLTFYRGIKMKWVPEKHFYLSVQCS